MADICPARLRCENVTIDIDQRRIVDNVSFDIPPGHVLGILGPNGSGKSTLVRSIFHSRRPSRGHIYLDEIDVWTQDIRWNSRHIAVVLQESASDFPLSCHEIVRMGRSPYLSGWKKLSDDDERLCLSAMRMMEVDHLADKRFSQISGGERQRVSIARALVQQGSVLILDEPTNHLDIHHQLKVLSLLRKLRSTVVVVVHDMNLAARFCDSLLVLHQGKTVAFGAADDVIAHAMIPEVYRVKTQVGRHPDGSAHLWICERD